MGAKGSGTHRGIYTNYCGSLLKVIDTSDQFDGKTIRTVTTGREALDGNRIALKVYFTDESQAIYIARLAVRGDRITKAAKAISFSAS